MQFRWLSTFQEWHMLRLLKKIIRAYQWKFSRFSISMWRKSFKDGVGSINFLSSQKTFFFSSIHCWIWIYGSVSGSIQFLPMSDSDEDMIESAEVSFVISTIKIALRPCVFWYSKWRRKHRVGVHTLINKYNPLLLTEFSPFSDPVHVFLTSNYFIHYSYWAKLSRIEFPNALMTSDARVQIEIQSESRCKPSGHRRTAVGVN